MACGAIGMCLSQQMALAEFHEQLMSNEIPQIDLSKSATPFLLNVPGLLYPQKTPKPETPVKVCSLHCCQLARSAPVIKNCLLSLLREVVMYARTASSS